MKKYLWVFITGVLVVGTVFASRQAPAASAKGADNILEFSTMVGVPIPYTGSVNAIRGVNGGGLPWVIGSGKGELKSNGDIEVKVRGLVLETTGANPITSFKAIVSCLSKDASGNANTVNVSTNTFPATTGPASSGGGNASIEDHVDLPSPCIAPIVFVTSPTGSWFAATGN